MHRLFDESYIHPYDRPYVADAYALPLDVVATGDEYLITAAMPGLKADDLSVEVLGEGVTIRGEIKSEQKDDHAARGYLLRERRYGKFERTLNFPVELDGAKAEASVENGVLTLRIPKAETAKPKMIKVKAK
jgi:HSP20 family protein